MDYDKSTYCSCCYTNHYANCDVPDKQGRSVRRIYWSVIDYSRTQVG